MQEKLLVWRKKEKMSLVGRHKNYFRCNERPASGVHPRGGTMPRLLEQETSVLLQPQH